MIPALFTSSSALDASQMMLSVVGNNLANSNTDGYKSQTLLFSNQFSQLISGASQPTATNGGRNPLEVGMGVQVASTDTNMTQGTFQSTGNPLDLAIQNNGYFVLQDSGQTVFTRAGSFSVDSSGNLVDPATGALVQRVGTVGEATATSPGFQVSGDSNINLSSSLSVPGQATQNITFNGNLSANAADPLAEILTSSQALTAGGVPATLNTSLDSLDQTQLSTASPTGYAAGDEIDITGTRVDGTAVNAAFDLTGNPATDTVGALVNAINQAFLSGTTATGATAKLNSSGQIVLTANQVGAATATLGLTSNPLNPSGTSTQFSSFVQTVAGQAGGTATSVIPIYDAQGTAHNVTFTFQKVGQNQWNVTASMNSSDGTITGFGEDNTVNGLTFNENGSLQSIAGSSTSEVLLTKNPMTVGAAPATLATALQSLDQHTPPGTPYGATDTIQITGTDYNGKTITPVTLPAFQAGAVPSTVGDLITAINSAYGGAVASLDSSGNIVLTATHTGQSALSINIADSSGNTGGSTTNFSPFEETAAGTNGDSSIAFQVANLAGFGGTQTINLNFGTANSFSGVTQTGAATSVAAASQDGYAEGTLESSSVNSNGVITGQFTNGQSEAIAQVALATFTNPGGLQNSGNNYLTQSTASGLANITAPGAGAAGTIQSGGLEGSNVDIGTEFTNLIAAQRGYEVNAKAFSIANTMMQDSLDLIR